MVEHSKIRRAEQILTSQIKNAIKYNMSTSEFEKQLSTLNECCECQFLKLDIATIPAKKIQLSCSHPNSQHGLSTASCPIASPTKVNI